MTNLKMPKFDNILTIGNVITLAAMIAGGLWFLATFKAEMEGFRDEVSGQVAALTAAQAETEARALDREARVRALELGAGRVDERLIGIANSLSRIERQLETQP